MDELRGSSHGGNLYLASQQFGINESDFLDYSANINPLGVPKELEDLIKSNIKKLVNYPNIDYSRLTSKVSEFLNVRKENVVVGNGATEVIYLALEELKPKKALLPVPTFSEYKGASNKFNVELQYLNLQEDDEFKLDLEILKGSIESDVELIFLCNPNNPTSYLIKKAEVEEIVKFALRKNINVILDESFIDLTEDEESNSLMSMVEEYKNLIIIRSFTKFFGIPGLRFGCGVCNKHLAEKIIKLRLPWSINYFATLVGEILNRDSEYIKNTQSWIKMERGWFYKSLLKINGLKVFYPNTNFVLVKIIDDRFTSRSLRYAMGKKSILIRDCSNFNNLGDKYVRFAIKDRESNIKFINTLEKVINKGEK